MLYMCDFSIKGPRAFILHSTNTIAIFKNVLVGFLELEQITHLHLHIQYTKKATCSL